MSRRKARRILVLERIGEDKWKALEAEAEGDRLTVLSAQILARQEGVEAPTAALRLPHIPNNVEIVLVSNSDKAVCRLLSLPPATAEQTRRMVARRLETELPYPVDQSTWLFERGLEEETSPDGGVLVMATPAAEIEEAEEELRLAGRRCTRVELDAAALAELAATTCKSEERVALAAVDEHRTTLVITHRGKLRYARRTCAGPAGATGDSTEELANELDQCIHHYALRANAAEPARMILVGERARAVGLGDALAARLEMPVETATLPGNVQIADPAAVQGDLLERFAACLGALIAVYRRQRGGTTTAPALRRRKFAFYETIRSKQWVLVGANVVLFALLVASLFGVRIAQTSAATRMVRKGRPLLQDMVRLGSEAKILEYEDRLQRPTLDSLLALAEVLPKGLKVAALTIDVRGKVTISGVSSSVEDASEKAISAMKASKAFVNTRFLGATKEKSGFRFRITCDLRRIAGGATR